MLLQWFHGKRKSQPGRHRRAFRPRVEALEDRLVPVTTQYNWTWTDANGDNKWEENGNWSASPANLTDYPGSNANNVDNVFFDKSAGANANDPCVLSTSPANPVNGMSIAGTGYSGGLTINAAVTLIARADASRSQLILRGPLFLSRSRAYDSARHRAFRTPVQGGEA
jgi:hypothetical protein